MFFQWVFKKPAPQEAISKLQEQIDVSPVVAQLLLDRNLNSPDQIQKFLNPGLDQLHDPHLMKDMEKAINRITAALRDGENILIYGDYDVDGTTAVSLLYEALFGLGGKVSFYIPRKM